MLETQVILGGTFNPVHFGHLRIAEEMHNLWPQATINLMPAANPPHRDTPSVSAEQRLEMLELATKESPYLQVDPRELKRTEASYSVVTLQQIRQESPANSLIFLMGTDAFNQLNKWYQWQELIKLCNILVVGRAGSELVQTGKVADFYQAHKVDNPIELNQHRSGKVAYLQLPHLEISSTHIRSLINQGKSPRFLLPSVILSYIETHNLYRQT